MNYLVETKTEYTIQLTNILIPLIYEGIGSIYEDAVKVANPNEELKTFQLFLKKIPKWNNTLLDNETNRILCLSTCPDLLKDLINAVIKANIMILTNTPPSEKSSLKINTKLDFKEFIHNCYIESARIFYNNPYLFYHKYSIYDLNRNQKDAKENIRNAIIEAIRKMLPLKMIINEYLGNSFKEDNNINIDNTLSEVEKHNLNTMIKVENIKIIEKNEDDDEINKIQSFENIKKSYSYPKKNSSIRQSDKIENIISIKKTENNDKIISIKKTENNDKIISIKKTENNDKITSIKKTENNDKIGKITENIVQDECDSVSYYKIDEKNKVLDSYSNNLNSNTQQIFYKNFSVELTEENKVILSDENKHSKIRKIPNI